jgi:hypothetical protein
MSLSGDIYNIDQSLTANGADELDLDVLNSNLITDNSGTTISNGIITTNNIVCNANYNSLYKANIGGSFNCSQLYINNALIVPSQTIGQQVTCSAGTTTSLPYGSNPTVINSGTPINAIFDFGIPQGQKGDTGLQGQKGDTGLQGIQGQKGDTGQTGSKGQSVSFYTPNITTLSSDQNATLTDSVSTNLLMTTEYHQLTFGIPKGKDGINGTNGTNGANGANGANGSNGQSVNFNTPTVSTLASGNACTILDVITTNNNIQNHQLNFGIPRGKDGNDGLNVYFYTPTATTLPYGSSCTITDNVSTSNNTQYHQLNFGVPLPINGTNGQSVSFYTPTITSLPYNGSASINDTVTYSNNTEYHQLDFSIPSGKNGLGVTVSVDSNVVTLDPSQSGYVQDIQTTSSASNIINHNLKFSLPRGISFIYKNAWIPSYYYSINDVVSFNGSSYICIQANTSHDPTDTYYWYYLALKGDRGDTGSKGDTGSSGGKGDTGDKGDKGDTGPAGSNGIVDIVAIVGAVLIALFLAPEWLALVARVSVLEGEMVVVQGEITAINTNLSTLNTKTTEMSFVPNFGTYFHNLSITDGVSDFIKFYTDGTSLFKNNMTFRRVVSGQNVDSIVLRADGTSHFTNTITCDTNIVCNTLNATNSITCSGNASITSTSTDGTTSIFSVNDNLNNVLLNATKSNLIVNNSIKCNDIDFNAGTTTLNIGKSSTLGYSINIGNPLGSIFPATMPTINLYGKVYFNSPDTILTNFNQF